MALMVHPDSGLTRIIPNRARSAYEQRGWKLAPAPAPEPETSEEAPERPWTTDSKADWVDYAKSQGVDVEGLTKAELIEACE